MTPSERAVAVRAVAAMVEFARLADSPDGLLVIDREAGLVDPNNPEAAGGKLLRLLQWHQIEWEAFMSSMPNRSWVREIVDQL
jgi:hypothetical protein